MAHTIKRYRNPLRGTARNVPFGFSWTVFFFGSIPALFRRDWVGFLLILWLGIVTIGFSNWVFAFTYNGWYERRLRDDGYTY